MSELRPSVQAPVGAMYRAFTDASREDWIDGGPRPLTTTIWYPAHESARVKRHVVALFDTGRYQIRARWMESPDRFPLIVLSHGTGGSAASIAWLGVRLASSGFVAAAVNHHGNTASEPRLTACGFVRWWERPQDLSFVVDSLLADTEIGVRIDPRRIGVAGFSLGGYAALATVGVRLAVHRWEPYCGEHPSDPICQPPPEASRGGFSFENFVREAFDKDTIEQANQSYADDRVRAVFAIAPVGGPILAAESMGSMTVPVSVVVGERDTQSIPEQVDLQITKRIPGASLQVVPKAGHYTFLSRGTFWSRLLARELFRDSFRLNRNRLHDRIGSEAAEFFRERL